MYTLLPFNFSRHMQEVLLVNECGDYIFITEENFDHLVRYELQENSDVFQELKSKLFLAQDNVTTAIRKTAAKYRSRKAFLRDFTSLHMMVITLRCNQKCEYCQVSCAEEDAHTYDMPINIAEKVIDMILKSPACSLKIEFQGGEPLLNWPTLEHSVLYAKEKAVGLGKELSFVLCTNLTIITKEQLFFCKEHGIDISTSLDGPEDIHDACRKLRIADKKTYNIFLEKLALTRSVVGYDGVSALMTTTAISVQSLEHVVEEYIRLGLNGIFIRSLNPYGFAAEQANELSYDMSLFAENYLKILKYILKRNENVFFPEHFATLLFSRILTPFPTGFVDLQSPAGVGIAGVIYDYDGSVFPADEARMLARMGDKHFVLGNVKENSFQEIFYGQKLQDIIAMSCIENTPTCAYCAYQAYCGTDPIRNYLESGIEIRNMAHTPFCRKHKSIFEGIFSILRNATDRELSIIWSWITCNPKLVDYNEKDYNI